MKTGSTLQELDAKLTRQSNAKHDLLLDTSDLTLLAPPIPADPDAPRGRPEIAVGREGTYEMTDLAQKQVAARLKIGQKMWGRLRDDHPDILNDMTNKLFRRENESRMIRAFRFEDIQEFTMRAFLSDRYRRLDHEELLQAILPILAEIDGAKVMSCEATDRRLYLKVLAPKVEGEVKKGDFVQAGVVIKNSEVGSGALSVEPWVYRLVCTNGMVAGKALKQMRILHLGGANENDETYKIMTDEAKIAQDKATFLKLRDATKAAVSAANFETLVSQMKEAAESPKMKDPVRGVERLARRFDLTEQERVSVMGHLIEGNDLTRWGALNAITRTAEDVASYDRATDVEGFGGDVLALSAREWDLVAAA